MPPASVVCYVPLQTGCFKLMEHGNHASVSNSDFDYEVVVNVINTYINNFMIELRVTWSVVDTC